MVCIRCQSSQFRVIDVERERRIIPEKQMWTVDERTDTRRIICVECGAVYLTETKIIAQEEFSEQIIKKVIKPIQSNLFG